MKIAQEVRAGNVIMVGKDPMVVQKAEFSKSGRNASVVKMKLKNLLTGTGTETIYRADEKFDVIQLEKKEHMKARGLASPDDADALALTFAEPVMPRDLIEYLHPTRCTRPDEDEYDLYRDLRSDEDLYRELRDGIGKAATTLWIEQVADQAAQQAAQQERFHASLHGL